MKPRVALAAVLLAGIAFASATALVRARERPIGDGRIAAPAEHVAPEGERIRVQVLNATRTRGLARRATMHLRDLGYDVVEIGNAAQELDSTLVIDRTADGRPEWTVRIAAALGGARVESRPDSSRYLDVTVLLGASWRPPSEPFYP